MVAAARVGHGDRRSHLCDVIAEWDNALRKFLEPIDDAEELLSDEQCHHQSSVLLKMCEKAWAQPGQNLGDLLVRVAMAVHRNSPGNIDAPDPAYPDDVIAEGGKGQMDLYSVAFVLRGLLDITGLRFDANGRLLSQRT